MLDKQCSLRPRQVWSMVIWSFGRRLNSAIFQGDDDNDGDDDDDHDNDDEDDGDNFMTRVPVCINLLHLKFNSNRCRQQNKVCQNSPLKNKNNTINTFKCVSRKSLCICAEDLTHFPWRLSANWGRACCLDLHRRSDIWHFSDFTWFRNPGTRPQPMNDKINCWIGSALGHELNVKNNYRSR